LAALCFLMACDHLPLPVQRASLDCPLVRPLSLNTLTAQVKSRAVSPLTLLACLTLFFFRVCSSFVAEAIPNSSALSCFSFIRAAPHFGTSIFFAPYSPLDCRSLVIASSDLLIQIAGFLFPPPKSHWSRAAALFFFLVILLAVGLFESFSTSFSPLH